MNRSNCRQVGSLKRGRAAFGGTMRSEPRRGSGVRGEQCGPGPGGAAEISRGPTSPRGPPPVPAIRRHSPRMGRWIGAGTIRREILRVRDPAPGQGVNRLLPLSGNSYFWRTARRWNGRTDHAVAIERIRAVVLLGEVGYAIAIGVAIRVSQAKKGFPRIGQSIAIEILGRRQARARGLGQEVGRAADGREQRRAHRTRVGKHGRTVGQGQWTPVRQPSPRGPDPVENTQIRRSGAWECAGPPAFRSNAPKAAEGCRAPKTGGSWVTTISKDRTRIGAMNLKQQWGARASRLLGSASRRTLVVVSHPDSGRRDADRCSRDGRAPHAKPRGSWVGNTSNDWT